MAWISIAVVLALAYAAFRLVGGVLKLAVLAAAVAGAVWLASRLRRSA